MTFFEPTLPITTPCLDCTGACPVLGRDVSRGHVAICQTGRLSERLKMMRSDPVGLPAEFSATGSDNKPSTAKTLGRSAGKRTWSAQGSRFHARQSVHGAFTHTCRFLGELLSREPCTCGAAGKISVYQCRNPDVKHKRCVCTTHDQNKFVDKDLRMVTTACNQCPLKEMTPIFVSTDQLWADVKILISRLPPDVTRIVGVARSGVNIASMVAMFLHVPFSIVRQSDGDLIDAGSGWRLWQGAPKTEGRTIVIDDTCMTGNSLKAVLPIVEPHFKQVQTATIYVNPLSAQKPDYYVKSLPWPHVLEWNMFNSVNTASCAFDFDGVLCHDCPSHEDDDGPRYLKWVQSVKPLYYVRRTSIPLIITARLEKYREPTLEWLERHGMRVDELIMGPWETSQERLEADIAAWKAGHAKTWFSRPDRLKPKMLIESNSSLAKKIAELAGGIVACPAAKRCYP